MGGKRGVVKIASPPLWGESAGFWKSLPPHHGGKVGHVFWPVRQRAWVNLQRYSRLQVRFAFSWHPQTILGTRVRIQVQGATLLELLDLYATSESLNSQSMSVRSCVRAVPRTVLYRYHSLVLPQTVCWMRCLWKIIFCECRERDGRP